jgi:hypothetical protein
LPPRKKPGAGSAKEDKAKRELGEAFIRNLKKTSPGMSDGGSSHPDPALDGASSSPGSPSARNPARTQPAVPSRAETSWIEAPASSRCVAR